MWVLKILTGNQAGTIFPLKDGANIIGRAPSCDIKIINPNISKQHLKIDVLGNKLIVSDLSSRNGSFLNGIQIRSNKYNLGDKLILHDVVMEILNAATAHPTSPSPSVHPSFQNQQAQNYGYDGNLAQQAQNNYSPQPHLSVDQNSGQQPSEQPQFQKQGIAAHIERLQNYIEEALLPGVYRLPEHLEFKWVLALFVAAFILFVTSLSSLPLMHILKTSIEQESRNRALTIGRNIARSNRAALMQGIDSAVSVDTAEIEPGVEEALIISAVNGNIIAPPKKANRVPSIPYIHEARKLNRESARLIDSDTIVALVPIQFYNAETGSQTVSAYAVIVYNLGSLAVDDNRTFSLFIQTFFIALIVGGILFFFMYKIIEFPLVNVNRQLDVALKERRDDVQHNYQFPALQNLISNINSALTRAISGGDENDVPVVEYDRNGEMANLIELIGFPALAITAHDQVISCVNYAFEERTGMNAQNIQFQTVDGITDQALRLSIVDLLDRGLQTPEQMISNELEITGLNFQVTLQAVYGSHEISYFIVVLLPNEEDGGEE